MIPESSTACGGLPGDRERAGERACPPAPALVTGMFITVPADSRGGEVAGDCIL